MKPSQLVTFDDVIPISGLKGDNIETVKQRVREIIDFHAEERGNVALGGEVRADIKPRQVIKAVA